MKLTKRQRRIAAKRAENDRGPNFGPCDLDKVSYIPPGMTRAFMNNKYIVMIYDNTITTKGRCTKALVQTLTDTPIKNHWSEMQRIKNQLFGKETTGIEYYPAESDLINDHNIYWMWIFEDGVLPKMIM